VLNDKLIVERKSLGVGAKTQVISWTNINSACGRAEFVHGLRALFMRGSRVYAGMFARGEVYDVGA
jgi:hypothetical protein